MPKQLKIDYSLCARAEKYATGENIHTLANLLTPYLVIPQLEEASVDSFRVAERRLRAFVTQIALSWEPRHIRAKLNRPEDANHAS
ncbi:MAG: hypothetical protein U1G07_12795 [Verrucomicrobiota bacterium]